MILQATESISWSTDIISLNINKPEDRLILLSVLVLLLCPFLLLLLSHFSRVWLCATPETAAHQTPPSLGFSRQEHWSGLPFPSPMHESEKSKWSHSRVRPSATPWTAAHQAPPSMGVSRQEYWSSLPLPSPCPFLFKFKRVNKVEVTVNLNLWNIHMEPT